MSFLNCYLVLVAPILFIIIAIINFINCMLTIVIIVVTNSVDINKNMGFVSSAYFTYLAYNNYFIGFTNNKVEILFTLAPLNKKNHLVFECFKRCFIVVSKP